MSNIMQKDLTLGDSAPLVAFAQRIQYLAGYLAHMSGFERHRTPFPPKTHGFVYYHPPTDTPPVNEGHLRIRVTESADPASFAHGQDLLYPDGQPWYVPAGRMAVTGSYRAFCVALVNDGLVTEAQLASWSVRYSARGKRSVVLHDLQTPFAINFGIGSITVRVPIAPDSDKTQRVVLVHPLTLRHRKERTSHLLATGKAVCRLEYTGVSEGHDPTMVALRVLRILNPFAHSEQALKSGILVDFPKEGDLFRRPFSDEPWMRSTRNSALRILWERWDSERKGSNVHV
ncbi:hypothetical protein OF83DRAFT_1175770 [Amylostereum chailletii]|nr:hypothetical protein OF83DRAFT_1175770 [Amylostereum chailletii]